MENQFFVDSEHLSAEALNKKHRLESDPFFRTNHMEYMEGMEIIDVKEEDIITTSGNAWEIL